MQVKTIQTDIRDNRKYLPVRKISHNEKGYKIFRYSPYEIDFFIGVDIDTEDIYIVPVEFSSKYSSSISINTLKEYKNNFNLLELFIGNNKDEADDIGESLTANAEGIV